MIPWFWQFTSQDTGSSASSASSVSSVSVMSSSSWLSSSSLSSSSLSSSSLSSSSISEYPLSSSSSASVGSVILSSSSAAAGDVPEEPGLVELPGDTPITDKETGVPPMVNYIRTLLMNRQRDGARLSDYGEEYISPAFVPRLLDLPVKRVHQILFGSHPDRLFINYRMRQILQLMHATPLSQDITAADSRITYLPFKDDLFDTAFRTTVQQMAGLPHTTHITGSYEANMGDGTAEQIWDVEVVSSGYVIVTKRRYPLLTQVIVVDGDEAIQLPGSELLLYLHDAGTGFKAQVTATARPRFNIAALLGQMINISGEKGLSTFFPENAEEPVATWANIYRNSHLAPMQFTALLLAVAHYTAKLPQRNDL